MEELRNLKQIYGLAAGRFNQYEGKDFVLPMIFKEQVKEINSNIITYNDYSAVIETRGNQNGVLNIFLPNQWFYIASYFTDFYNELQHYKKEALKVTSKERLKILNGATLSDAEENRLQHLSLSEQSKNYLRLFMTDYSWWSGAKTIDRGDFYVSPILNSARLVNASQTFVAELCAFLADKNDLVQAIISGEESASEKNTPPNITLSLQQIFYGAPGTGKSHKIKDDVDVKVADEKNLVFRTTFHPDSDYSTFVGCYKPTKAESKRLQRMNLSLEDLAKELGSYYTNEEFGKIGGIQKFCFEYYPYIDGEYMSVNVTKLLELAGIPKDYNVEINKYIKFCHLLPKQDPDKITYAFIPQAFLQAYVAAWNNPDDKVFLVIEEINRGNCAQIFGDLFQLLDRDDDGASEYPIMADKDLAKYLNGNDEEGRPVLTNKDDIKDGKLRLPKNLYIWATMNTSDQSLFPIDSAFKRRWDWVYMPIADAKKNYVIEIDNDQYDWWNFLEAINAIIESTTHSEDKKLGYFFAKAKDGRITVETFVSKVIFYLWNDVFKDNETNHKAFKDSDGELLPFRKFFHHDGTVDTNMVIKFLQDLEVFPFEHSDDGTTAVSDTTPNTKRQRDKSRYRVNGTDNLNKAQMSREAFRLYIEAHPDADAQTIAQAWNGLGLKDYVRHLVETEAEYNARTKDSTDSNKRATEFELSNGEKIYLSTQFGIGNIGKFMDAVNNAGWNIRIENQA